MLGAGRAAVALCGLLCCSAGVRAEVGWTGQKLRQACAEAAERRPGGDCAIYVRGVMDRYHERLAAHCPPTEANFDEIVRGVTADLQQHEAALDGPASDLILDSIKRRYGCQW